MDENGFMNAGISPWAQLNRGADEPFFKSNHDQFSYLESPLPSNEALALRELIGRLSGGIGTPTAFLSVDSSNFASPTADCSSLASSQLNLAIMDPVSITNLESSDALTPALSSLTADPDFVERAAKFSRFECRSFNCRSPPPSGLSSTGEMDFKFSSNPVVAGNVKLSRVLNSPALKQGGSARRNVDQGEISMYKKMGSNANSSIEVSSTSERISSGETGSKISKGMSCRKRKAASRGKTKDESNSAMVVESGENENGKRSKLAEGGIIEATIEEETKVGEKPSANQKPLESPKDYIHVRARRGQATDSHSLAERVRREKISERMKLLQDLVPGCNKVTGKALMLDEIINYVQSLQRQVEFLSMKLSSLNPDLDSNMKNLLSKDMFQQNSMTVPQQMYSLNSSSSSFHHQNLPQLHYNHCNSSNISTAPLNQCPMDSLSMDACNLEIHFPSVNGFNQTLPQFPSLLSEDELHNIVQMGFVSKPVPFAVSNPLPDMKLES